MPIISTSLPPSGESTDSEQLTFPPVNPDEMAFALTLFVSAAGGQISAGRKPVSIRNRQRGQDVFLDLSLPNSERQDRQQVEAALDTTLFQAFLIVWEHYKGDAAQASLAARVLGLYFIMVRTKGAALQGWMRANEHNEEFVVMDPAVVEALATVPLTVDGYLRESALLTRLQNFEAAPMNELAEPRAWPSSQEGMAQLVRKHDWSKTPLGDSAKWPQSLRTAVELVLACRFPMVILWGRDLIQIYNQGYCDIMGSKHPRGLGQSTRECWPEVWHINEAIYDRVFRGETVTYDDGLYPIHRHGHLEEAYFTLCYSPLRDEAGVIQGVLVTVFETTERVRAELEQSTANPSRQQ